MKLRVKMDRGQFVAATTEADRRIATAMTKAMRQVGKEAVAAGNANIQSAGFSSRKWNLKAKNYPTSGVSLLPEIWLHSRMNFQDVFEEGKHIVGNPLLWLPLPSVPKWPGDPTRQMSPKKYAQTIGPLFSLKRPGKTPLLAAPISGAVKPQPFGRFVGRARLKRGFTGRGALSFVPLFVGVREVQIEKRFNIKESVDNVVDKFPGFYAQNEGKDVI